MGHVKIIYPMLRTLILLVWIPLLWQPAGGQTASVRNNVAQNPKENPNFTSPQPQIGTEATPLVVEMHPRPETKEQAAKAEADKDHAASVERWTLIFTGAAAFFTGLLVWVGCKGAHAALKTLTAIERQSALMQAQFDQWVDFQNWFAATPQDNSVPIEVSMVNPTEFPISITDGRITILETGGSVRYEMAEPTYLAPHQPHPIRLEASLTDEERKRGYISFRVTVEFAFLHRITKEKQIRRFDGRIKGRFGANGQWSSEFVPGTQLNVENERTDQRPN